MTANNTSSNSNNNLNNNNSFNNKPNTVTYTKYNKTIHSHHHNHNHHHHAIDKPPHNSISNDDKLIYLSKPKLKKLLIEKKLKDWSFGLI
ncbi:hypothetical protein CONCODRAFT_80880 [Conidiobolus coronatus NRRL 28638]|uniref:Uncharacterized protein n=1 Tax=Conidiobolus coronatus (strain ATCC 28846 / CBS 209.66 / NRRL 28638) TaxID=796925 RepID=A0A137NQP8_CONC2|nr:hypothetical protein CONCODRAFT_80880 [Conidiobolus coronatus NRRL 28638]|eukprot:KXN65000.1 hypothetical protein CONCODRAFT_80880 [Conidiobolus coronatus NRRL 28638]